MFAQGFPHWWKSRRYVIPLYCNTLYIVTCDVHMLGKRKQVSAWTAFTANTPGYILFMLCRYIFVFRIWYDVCANEIIQTIYSFKYKIYLPLEWLWHCTALFNILSLKTNLTFDSIKHLVKNMNNDFTNSLSWKCAVYLSGYIPGAST